MGEIEKAQLIFLDAIERRSAAVEAALAQQPASVQKVVSDATGALVTALTQSIAAIPQPKAAKDPESLSPLVEAVQNLHNVVVMAANKIASKIDEQNTIRHGQHAELVAEIKRKRSYKFNIDRNYQTKLIQGVTVEETE